jgi:hypothetical protein
LKILGDLAPELLELDNHRKTQKARFGGEFLLDIIEGATG